MSLKQYRNAGYGGRHVRKKSKRPLPLPKKALQDKKKDSLRDEDYVNLGPKHKLSYLRYPSGSGKRPPPKPRRSPARELRISSNKNSEQINGFSPANDINSMDALCPEPLTPPICPVNNYRPVKSLSPNPSPPVLHHASNPRPVKKLHPNPSPARPPQPKKNLEHILHITPPCIPTQQQKCRDVRKFPPRPPPPRPPFPKKDGENKTHPKFGPKSQVRPDFMPLPDPRTLKSNSQEKLLNSNGIVQNHIFNQSHDTIPTMQSLKRANQSLDANSPVRQFSLSFDALHSARALPGPNQSPDTTHSSSTLTQPSKPVKQPILPPAVKPRKPKTEVTKQNSCSFEIVPNGTTRTDPVLSYPSKPHPSPPPSGSDDAAAGSKPKPPLPKPRQKKSSYMRENSDVIMTSSHPPLSNGMERGEDEVPSHTRPIPRTRLTSKGLPATGQIVINRQENREEIVNGVTSSSPFVPIPRARVNSKGRSALSSSPKRNTSGMDLKESLEKKIALESLEKKATLASPPVPVKRTFSREVSLETGSSDVPLAPVALARDNKKKVPLMPPRVMRKKGGGIRKPLWKAPPPPPWTPPSTPTLKESRQEKSRSKPSPLSPISEDSHRIPKVMSPLSITSNGTPSSFILPPFRSSFTSTVTSEEDLRRSQALEQEPPVSFGKPPATTPTSKSPLNFEFEENLFRDKSVMRRRSRPSLQDQKLPLSVVQDLQNNFRKQIR